MRYKRIFSHASTNAVDGTLVRLPGDGAELLRKLRSNPGAEFVVEYTGGNEFRLSPVAPSAADEDDAVRTAAEKAEYVSGKGKFVAATKQGARETSVRASRVKGGDTMQELPAHYHEFRSEPMAAAHEIIADMFDLGLVDKVTMRQFDEACLMPVAAAFSPAEVKAIRMREGSSQAVFAKYLNVATSTVSQWERGERKPEGPALKLLALINARGLSYIG